MLLFSQALNIRQHASFTRFSLLYFSEYCKKLDTAMKVLYVSPKNQRQALVTAYIP